MLGPNRRPLLLTSLDAIIIGKLLASISFQTLCVGKTSLLKSTDNTAVNNFFLLFHK